MANRIKVQVMGNSYFITTERSEAQMRAIESQLDEQMNAIMDTRPNLSVVDTLVVLVLNLMDELSGSEEATDRMREQLTQYLEDAARVRMELEDARREIQRLNRDLEAARR